MGVQVYQKDNFNYWSFEASTHMGLSCQVKTERLSGYLCTAGNNFHT